jgi:hypothetical protein
MSKRRIDPEEVRRLMEEGLSYREIALRVGCAPCTLTAYRMKFGLPPRKRGRHPLTAILRNKRRRVLLREMLGLAKSVKRLEKELRRIRKEMEKHHFRSSKLLQTEKYWEEITRRLSVLVLHFPQLAKEMGFGVDGMPEYLEREIRSLYEEE